MNQSEFDLRRRLLRCAAWALPSMLLLNAPRLLARSAATLHADQPATALAPPRSGAARSRASVAIEDHYQSADGNDWSPAAKRAIAWLTERGGGQLRLKAGDYPLARDGSNYWCIRLNHNIEVIGDGAKTRLIQAAGTPMSVVVISTGPFENIAVRNLLIDGNRSNQAQPFGANKGSGNHGIFCRGTVGAVFEEIDCREMYGDGIYVGQEQRPSQDISVLNCRVKGTDRQCFTIAQAASKITFRRCVAEAPRFQGIDLEPRHMDVQDLLIDDCDLGGGIGAKSSAFNIYGWGNNRNFVVKNSRLKGSIQLLQASDVMLTGNVIEVPEGHGVPAIFIRGPSARCHIEGNQLRHSGRDGFRGSEGVLGLDFYKGQPADITVIGNTVETKVNRIPFFANGVDGSLKVEGNTFQANGLTDCALLSGGYAYGDVSWRGNHHFKGRQAGLRIAASGFDGGFRHIDITDNDFHAVGSEAIPGYGIYCDAQGELSKSLGKVSGNRVDAGMTDSRL